MRANDGWSVYRWHAKAQHTSLVSVRSWPLHVSPLQCQIQFSLDATFWLRGVSSLIYGILKTWLRIKSLVFIHFTLWFGNSNKINRRFPQGFWVKVWFNKGTLSPLLGMNILWMNFVQILKFNAFKKCHLNASVGKQWRIVCVRESTLVNLCVPAVFILSVLDSHALWEINQAPVKRSSIWLSSYKTSLLSSSKIAKQSCWSCAALLS